MPRASFRSVLTGMVLKAVRTCRVSSNSTASPFSRKPHTTRACGSLATLVFLTTFRFHPRHTRWDYPAKHRSPRNTPSPSSNAGKHPAPNQDTVSLKDSHIRRLCPPRPLRHLCNRVFSSYENIVGHCCYAWIKLADQPWAIISIGSRDWA
jgi:hypothetical protein